MLTGNSYYSKQTLKDNLDDDLEFYEFIEDIMEDKSIPTEERKIFWDEFGEKYYHDIMKNKFYLHNSRSSRFYEYTMFKF